MIDVVSGNVLCTGRTCNQQTQTASVWGGPSVKGGF